MLTLTHREATIWKHARRLSAELVREFWKNHRLFGHLLLSVVLQASLGQKSSQQLKLFSNFCGIGCELSSTRLVSLGSFCVLWCTSSVLPHLKSYHNVFTQKETSVFLINFVKNVRQNTWNVQNVTPRQEISGQGNFCSSFDRAFIRQIYTEHCALGVQNMDWDLWNISI